METHTRQLSSTSSGQTQAWTWLRKASLPFCSVVGVLLALACVLAWFPKGSEVWTLPIHQIDAPAHYYFIRRILDDGLGAATHLWPNDAYYPPMFHIMAAGLIKLAGVLGISMNVYTAFNLVWLATSGLLWPAGILLLSTYWTRQVDGHGSFASQSLDAEEQDSTHLHSLTAPSFPARQWRPFSCAMAIIVPVLAVSSAAHPYSMLSSGPLVAFGLATSLLPFWLYTSLRLLDSVEDFRQTGTRPALFWILMTALLGALCLFAHPRIVFTWLLLMAPFLLLRLPWKWIAGLAALVLAGAVAFFFYMKATYKSNRYLNPGEWFHTYTPNRTVAEALGRFVNDDITGPLGVCMAALVLVSIFLCLGLAIRPQLTGLRRARKDAISILLAAALVALVYVCSTSLTGWFPNIITAAWYRAETRPLTMIPFAVLLLIVFALSALAASPGAGRSEPIVDAETVAQSTSPRKLAVERLTTAISLVLVALLALGCQLDNPQRQELSDRIDTNIVLDDSDPYEQLTQAKLEVLAEVIKQTGTDATIISDPLNGSMYGATVFGGRMLYPIYNPMIEKNGAIFGQVERAFGSGDKPTLLGTVCPIGPTTPEYFLSMGPQAPSLQMFTFKEQYYPFQNQSQIDQYVSEGVLTKVEDFSSKGAFAKDWALYRFACAH
ncbi:hypothetical protein CRD60_04785 [Bifidobacterium aemilianum]|uniref:Transmembrane protein alanine and leucine rich n=1 Tax=Bifidobacterium aemilianum TaxID=2493120 RepID=A0A366K826_9BIFI|nr:DUF6541 family protein [Bifidobacterium aemilianum]RBP97900.1 hypothetical protein CRD60_04785 [Bifidobacterium aemilianum]